MGVANFAVATCSHCGAVFRLFTIFNRDMGGLAKAWRRKHEHKCASRSPKQRRAWARPYAGKDSTESSITVDMGHHGFVDAPEARK